MSASVVEEQPAAVVPALNWGDHAPGLVLSEDELDVKKETVSGCVLAEQGFSRGIHCWEVTIKAGNLYCSIGAATNDLALNSPNIAPQRAWVWVLKSNHLYASTMQQSTAFSAVRVKVGDRVRCILDMDVGTLSFQVNDDGPVLPAFTGLQGKEMYPMGYLSSGTEWTGLRMVEKEADATGLEPSATAASGAAESTLDATAASVGSSDDLLVGRVFFVGWWRGSGPG